MANIQHKKDYQSGFTLIEVMISVLILGMVMAAAMSLLSSNLNSANLVKNNFIASGLAQEGIEVTRNIRDSDWYTNRAFGFSIPDGNYNVQWNSTSLTSYNPNSFLKKDDTTGLYSYDFGNNTAFKRWVEISTPVPNVEKKVVVKVSWFERGVTKTISAEDHLFDWR